MQRSFQSHINYLKKSLHCCCKKKYLWPTPPVSYNNNSTPLQNYFMNEWKVYQLFWNANSQLKADLEEDILTESGGISVGVFFDGRVVFWIGKKRSDEIFIHLKRYGVIIGGRGCKSKIVFMTTVNNLHGFQPCPLYSVTPISWRFSISCVKLLDAYPARYRWTSEFAWTLHLC